MINYPGKETQKDASSQPQNQEGFEPVRVQPINPSTAISNQYARQLMFQRQLYQESLNALHLMPRNQVLYSQNPFLARSIPSWQNQSLFRMNFGQSQFQQVPFAPISQQFQQHIPEKQQPPSTSDMEEMKMSPQTSQKSSQSQGFSSTEQINDLQITEILAKQRRKELLNTLDRTTNSKEIVIRTKITKKDLKSSRGSIYRGVSRNGKKWQVQLLGNLKKHYIGSISTEVKAARIYDAHAILAHGLKAKTNFSYTKQQIQRLLEMEDENLPDYQFEMEDSADELTQGNNLLARPEEQVKKSASLEESLLVEQRSTNFQSSRKSSERLDMKFYSS